VDAANAIGAALKGADSRPANKTAVVNGARSFLTE
jgi:hypothetical protein